MGAKKLELITLDEAVEVLNAHHGCKAYTKKTLYNKIYEKVLDRHGPRHVAQVDKKQLLEVLG